MRKALIRKKLLVSSRFRETETRNKPFEQEREINRGKKKGKKERGETTKKKIEETDETREIAIKRLSLLHLPSGGQLLVFISVIEAREREREREHEGARET